MTLEKLNKYFEKIKKLNKAREILQILEASAQPKGQRLTGMPHSQRISDITADVAIEIMDAKSIIAYLESEIVEMAEVDLFIDSIDDCYTKIIFRLRFQRAMTWEEVTEIIGGGNTVDSIKSICYRYLKVATQCNAVQRNVT